MPVQLCLLILFLFALVPCKATAQNTGRTAYDLINTPTPASLVETDTEALLHWRDQAQEKPTLLLFSNNPFLMPVPAELLPQALQLAREGSAVEVRARAVNPSSNPLLLPGMGLSAALEAGFFSRLVWVLPLDEQAPMPDIDQVRNQLLSHGAVNEKEAARLVKNNHHISGRLHGVPFEIHGSNTLPQLSSPAWVHIDLSYFAARYRNEIKTPVYTLVGEELKRWQTQHWAVSGATISFGNLLGNVPLGMRFLGRDLRQLLEHPAMLDDDLPRTWKLRARALYLENFFKKEKMLEIFNEMQRLEPDNPDVLYNLYQVQRRFKDGNAALKLLADAVRQDPCYALEYYTLAEIAQGKNRADAALRMLTLAQEQQPRNPVPLMKQMEILSSGRHDQPVAPLRKKLLSMPWSKTYYPELPKQLETVDSALKARTK